MITMQNEPNSAKEIFWKALEIDSPEDRNAFVDLYSSRLLVAAAAVIVNQLSGLGQHDGIDLTGHE